LHPSWPFISEYFWMHFLKAGMQSYVIREVSFIHLHQYHFHLEIYYL
jgi:hypothetical protein